MNPLRKLNGVPNSNPKKMEKPKVSSSDSRPAFSSISMEKPPKAQRKKQLKPATLNLWENAEDPSKKSSIVSHQKNKKPSLKSSNNNRMNSKMPSLKRDQMPPWPGLLITSLNTSPLMLIPDSSGNASKDLSENVTPSSTNKRDFPSNPLRKLNGAPNSNLKRMERLKVSSSDSTRISSNTSMRVKKLMPATPNLWAPAEEKSSLPSTPYLLMNKKPPRISSPNSKPSSRRQSRNRVRKPP